MEEKKNLEKIAPENPEVMVADDVVMTPYNEDNWVRTHPEHDDSLINHGVEDAEFEEEVIQPDVKINKGNLVYIANPNTRLNPNGESSSIVGRIFEVEDISTDETGMDLYHVGKARFTDDDLDVITEFNQNDYHQELDYYTLLNAYANEINEKEELVREIGSIRAELESLKTMGNTNINNSMGVDTKSKEEVNETDVMIPGLLVSEPHDVRDMVLDSMMKLVNDIIAKEREGM